MELLSPYVYTFFGVLTAAILLLVGFLASNNASARRPGRLQTLMEIVVDGMRNIFMGALGPGGEVHLPLAFTLFFYIFFCNMLELIPGYKAATSDPSNTLAMGVIVFFYVQYQGIKARGIGGYLKHFLGPVLALAPLFIIIEIIGEFAKPFSLGMRLFGNIYGEDVMSDLATKGGLLFVPLRLLINGLQIFTGAIQAFMFALLTCSYIAIMTEHHEDDHGSHDSARQADIVMADQMAPLGGSLS